MLQFEGSSSLRDILACSLLARRSVKISNIHTDDDPCGVNRHFEANLLKFVQRISPSSKMEVHDGNTTLMFHPGLIMGGTFEHEVPATRCVTYLVELALMVLPFAKSDSKIRFLGNTQGEIDLSIDAIRVVTCRVVQLFGIDVSIRIVRRGCGDTAGGCVELSISALRQLRSVKLIERGKVKRIRGIAFSCRTAPDLPQRAATSAKGVLLNILPDVFVVTDVDKNSKGSGYGVILVAETTSKIAVIAQETIAEGRESAEEVGQRAAMLLLDQIAVGGCVDAHHQGLALLFMGVGPAEASTVRFGPLSATGVTMLTLLETFFGVKCAIKSTETEEGLPSATIVTCIGANLINIAKKSS
eukprot:GILI01026304.1.p1 GENE.GILI01026304.1~~GILI01026304.1.p1  ORF type:complete len:357 (-),score=55.66 GILI01026304.1:85-1155(-)